MKPYSPRGTLRLALTTGEQLPQPGKGFPVQLRRTPASLAPGPKLSPAVRVRPCAAVQGPKNSPPTLRSSRSIPAIAMPPQTSSMRT
jgi:hypothetical protein